MSEEREFRIGDVASDLTGRAVPRAEPEAGLDRETFPTLAAFVAVSPAEFRTRLDSLHGRARATEGDLQAALQAAGKVLPGIHKVYGG
jgi:hypothetical protein